MCLNCDITTYDFWVWNKMKLYIFWKLTIQSDYVLNPINGSYILALKLISSRTYCQSQGHTMTILIKIVRYMKTDQICTSF